MAQIRVNHLTFCYDGSVEPVFEQASFLVDTDWKLGLIGRNGKGKTTLLRLLMGKYAFCGTIQTSVCFDYFPYQVTEEMSHCNAGEFLEVLKPGSELWRVICELEQLQLSAEVLYRPFETLSYGEQTKVLLALLFSGEHEFLLIDEPTNHLDWEARQMVKAYLKRKKGFILVSHDRDLLDACIDHVLVLNRKTIEVQSGNFSVWWENKQRRDHFAQSENEKHLREIASLKKTAQQSRRWAEKNEDSKIGFDPIKEHDRFMGTRAYIGAKTKKMQSRVKQYERRINKEIEEQEGLLQDIEKPAELKLNPLTYQKELLVWGRDVSLSYSVSSGERLPESDSCSDTTQVLSHLGFELHRGERVVLQGKNGCGKSSLLKAVFHAAGYREESEDRDLCDGNSVMRIGGSLQTGAGLVISYVSQDTSFLKGSIWEFCRERNLNQALFCALLRQLDLERAQFEKSLEEFSEGQKKKVLIAASLMTPAHLYIWDEPLNYIDVFTRMQIEELILNYQPTMLVVEHDVYFQKKIATRIVSLPGRSQQTVFSGCNSDRHMLQ